MMKIGEILNEFGFDIVKKSVAIVALGAVVTFVLRFLLRLWKRRQLRAKISAFRRDEENRREKIKERFNSEDGDSSSKKISSLSFAELVGKLKNGELKAVEVLRAYQQTALNVTNEVNAVTEFVENADETAENLDQLPTSERGPLHGVPFSVKEGFYLKGTEATCGHSQFLGYSINFETAPLIKFLEGLGAIPFAKTNIPQALFSFDSRNPIYGITKNPLDLTRGPGGSTSGEGALICAKGSPFGLGSDVGGSLRAPTAWCGLFTLKPGSRRILQGGDFLAVEQGRIIWDDLFSFGFITQDIDTLVTLHRLLYSKATFDRFAFNTMAPVQFREDLFNNSDQKLRIGYCDFDGIIEPVPAMKRALKEAREHLEKMGHQLVPWNEAFSSDEKTARNFLKKGYMFYLNTLMIDGLVDTIKSLKEDVEISYPNKVTYHIFRLPNWLKVPFRFAARFVMGKLGSEMAGNMWTGEKPHDVNLLYRRLAEYRRQFAAHFEAANFDALLWPAMPFPALPLDAPREISPALSYFAFFNVVDWPSGVCPFGGGVTADDEAKMRTYPNEADPDIYHRHVKRFSSMSSSVGLPLAVQIAAPQFKEEIVLRLMKELSQ